MSARDHRQERFRKLVDEFVAHYNRARKTDWKVLMWLDETAVEGRKSECIVGDDAPRLAVEHTLVQPFTNAKLDDARFQEIFGVLEAVVGPLLPCQINLVIPAGVLSTANIRRDTARLQIAEWLVREAPKFFEGRSTHRLDCLPCEISIGKQSDRPPLLVAARFSPDDGARVPDAKRALTDKEEVLRIYKQEGLATALPLECNNIALDNAAVVGRDVEAAIAEGVPCGNADTIWVADADSWPPIFRQVR